MLCNKEGDSGRKSTQCKHGARTAAARRRASQAAPRPSCAGGLLTGGFPAPAGLERRQATGGDEIGAFDLGGNRRRWSGTPDASRRFFRHWPGHGPIELGENLARRPDRSTAMEFAGTPPSSDCHNLMPGHFQWMTTAHGGRNMCVQGRTSKLRNSQGRYPDSTGAQLPEGRPRRPERVQNLDIWVRAKIAASGPAQVFRLRRACSLARRVPWSLNTAG